METEFNLISNTYKCQLFTTAELLILKCTINLNVLLNQFNSSVQRDLQFGLELIE